MLFIFKVYAVCPLLIIPLNVAGVTVPCKTAQFWIVLLLMFILFAKLILADPLNTFSIQEIAAVVAPFFIVTVLLVIVPEAVACVWQKIPLLAVTWFAPEPLLLFTVL